MYKEDIKKIKAGQFIKFSYMPEGKVHTREVLKVDKKHGEYAYIAGIMKDTLFMVMHSEIIDVIESDKEPTPA